MATDETDEKDEKKEAAPTETAAEAPATEAAATEPAATEKTEEVPPVNDPKPEAAVVTVKEAEAAKHADTDEPLVAEPDRVNVGMILGITVAIVVSTVAVVIGVREFFAQTIRGEVDKKVLQPEDPMKKELHVVEQAKLTKYQWVNQKEGVLRIPVARARELVLADYGKMPPYVPGQPGAATAPEPTPAPAPEASSSVAPSGSGSAAPMPSVAPPASASASAPPKASASAPHKH